MARNFFYSKYKNDNRNNNNNNIDNKRGERYLEYIEQLCKIIWEVFVNFFHQAARNWISPINCN